MYQLYRNPFDNTLGGILWVKKFVIEFVIQKNYKNAKTLAVQKAPAG